MKMDDQKLLLNIFDVSQCDRTEEGDAFTPPDPNLEYIVKVRSLVGEEWVVLEVKSCVRQVSVTSVSLTSFHRSVASAIGDGFVSPTRTS